MAFAFSMENMAWAKVRRMNSPAFHLSRREMTSGVGLLASCVMLARPICARNRFSVALEEFGAHPGQDAGAALQRALDELGRRGGGILRIGGAYSAGIVTVRGADITIDGAGGTLRDTRLVVAPEARRLRVRDLTLLETRGGDDSYLLDIAGSDCQFENVALIKRPVAGGYQAYLRGTSRSCSFHGLRLAGSNGVFVAGKDHTFENFELTSTMRRDVGGDDAFALKAPGLVTERITIRNGTVRGYAAVISIGSEIGSSTEHPNPGIVRGVRVENVQAADCQMVCFIKPGALIYDWRSGLVEDVVLDTISLTDLTGFLYSRGLAITAGRGARVRKIVARNIMIAARAHTQGVMPTSAIDLGIRSDKPGAIIEDIDIQLTYDGRGNSGYPVDHIVRVEKDDPSVGLMRNIVIDVAGNDARIAGIHVGGGLDDAVTISRARLSRVALDPPASLGAAGIWADSRLKAENVQIQTVRGPQRGGRAH